MLGDTDAGIADQFRYLSEEEGFPVYSDSHITFFPDALSEYREIMDAVKMAQDYIFMEYHAIEDRKAFRHLKQALARKVSEGVEVRILYDDMGSIGLLSRGFRRQMEAIGINCRVFNRISIILRKFMNNRDHRKMTIIDGRTAFTGGFNLVDECFNYKHPYGQWKDTGVRMTGNVVNSMTEMFLAMWDSPGEEKEDFEPYFRRTENRKEGEGFIQPFSDDPLDDSYVAENTYMNMIRNARRSLYLTTPYLIPTDEMQQALISAAERGVDVRIITPGIPDKKLVYRATRANYADLLSSGIRIYEYSPGFLHAKQMIADDEIAIVGTINLDYRSMYYHFENAVLMYRANAVRQIAHDFADLFAVSREVKGAASEKNMCYGRMLDVFLRLASPLF